MAVEPAAVACQWSSAAEAPGSYSPWPVWPDLQADCARADQAGVPRASVCAQGSLSRTHAHEGWGRWVPDAADGREVMENLAA